MSQHAGECTQDMDFGTISGFLEVNNTCSRVRNILIISERFICFGPEDGLDKLGMFILDL